MAQLKVTLRGITPLMMHNPLGSMPLDDKPKTRSQRIVPPKEEAEAGTYRNEEGLLVFPASSIRPCILFAGIGSRLGNRSVRSILGSALLNVSACDGNPEWLLTTDHNGVPLTDYEIDIRRVVFRSGGKAVGIMRARPKLNEWQMEVLIEYSEQFASRESVLEYLQRAGIVSGLGDFRPQREGTFGRFEVLEGWEHTTEK